MTEDIRNGGSKQVMESEMTAPSRYREAVGGGYPAQSLPLADRHARDARRPPGQNLCAEVLDV